MSRVPIAFASQDIYKNMFIMHLSPPFSLMEIKISESFKIGRPIFFLQ